MQTFKSEFHKLSFIIAKLKNTINKYKIIKVKNLKIKIFMSFKDTKKKQNLTAATTRSLS